MRPNKMFNSKVFYFIYDTYVDKNSNYTKFYMRPFNLYFSYYLVGSGSFGQLGVRYEVSMVGPIPV